MNAIDRIENRDERIKEIDMMYSVLGGACDYLRKKLDRGKIGRWLFGSRLSWQKPQYDMVFLSSRIEIDGNPTNFALQVNRDGKVDLLDGDQNEGSNMDRWTVILKAVLNRSAHS